jgi:hypothetical protein
MDVEYAERCGICAVGPGAAADIVARCSIVVVELPEHFQAIEDALPRGIDALDWNIGLCCAVRFIVHSLSPRAFRHGQGGNCGERERIQPLELKHLEKSLRSRHQRENECVCMCGKATSRVF